MISYRATLDVSEHTLTVVCRVLAAHRNQVDRRPWQRAATVQAQAMMVLQWFRDGTGVAALARDTDISQATAYRYLHEGIDVLAAQAPDLHDKPAEPAERAEHSGDLRSAAWRNPLVGLLAGRLLPVLVDAR